MKYYIAMAVLLLLIPVSLLMAQDPGVKGGRGSLSIGTRNTFSVFSDDQGVGMGIGGQLRYQISRRLNTEWFLDYITSKFLDRTYRNDYHIGWSMMFYPGKNVQFKKFFQPYIFAGHCFDYSKVTDQNDSSNFARRWSMAAQGGLGTHLNISPRLDCSIAAQYMLHFGKEIETSYDEEAEKVLIYKKDYTSPHRHTLLSVSFNYKLVVLTSNGENVNKMYAVRY